MFTCEEDITFEVVALAPSGAPTKAGQPAEASGLAALRRADALFAVGPAKASVGGDGPAGLREVGGLDPSGRPLDDALRSVFHAVLERGALVAAAGSGTRLLAKLGLLADRHVAAAEADPIFDELFGDKREEEQAETLADRT
ncbi:MAG: hypothetical protein LBO20_08870 [Bifidobacteriaceae bacterium]|nr:hypothetical protein [Bifidobacteriaceae bacterium]